MAGCTPAAAPAAPSQSSAPAAEPIILGYLTSMNVPAVTDGYYVVEMAVEEVNARDGGIVIDGLKRPVKVMSADTRDLEAGVPAQDSILAVKNLISSQKLAGIVNFIARSEVQNAVIQNTADDKIPQILAGGVNSVFKKTFASNPAKFKYQFKNTPTDIDLVTSLMSVMALLKQKYDLKTTYLFGEDVDFARSALPAAQALLEKSGWTVKGTSFIPLGTTDYSSIMGKFRDSGAQVGFYLLSTEGAPMPRQYKAMGLNALMVGSAAAFFGEKSWENTQGGVENFCILTLGTGHTTPGPKLPVAQAFYNSALKKLGHHPSNSGGISHSYDAANMLMSAWKALGTLDPDKVVSYLESTPYDGVLGRTTFSAADHQAPYGTDPIKTLTMQMIQWQNKERVVVYPENIASAELVIPK